MPELPEVQTVVDTLRPRVVGRVIDRLTLRRADIVVPVEIDLAGKLKNRGVVNVFRRGKRIIFELERGEHFYIHLGMSGRITIEDSAAATLPHTHAVFHFAGFEIRFRDPRRFGGIWWLGTETAPDENMGPEPLQLRAAQLAVQLAGTSRTIKVALLDQTIIAGLGNIYVDESLFRAGIHPTTPARDLDGEEIAWLNRAIKAVLRRALHHRGSTLRDYFDANGKAGGFQKLHSVYDREGKPCRRCKTPVERIVLGARSTHFCPSCQRK